MSYRRLKADYLFDGFELHRDKVLICESDGTIEGCVTEETAGSDPEQYAGILTPGFVNCHCHLELSHLRGKIPENQGLVNFVFSVVSKRNQSEELKLDAIKIAEAEMQKDGIVAVGDICNTGDTRFQKSAKHLSYYNFIEVLGWDPKLSHDRFEDAKKIADLFIESGADSQHLSFSPHAPYSVSDELWKLIQPNFFGKTITIHNQECAAENEFFQSGAGELSRMYSLMKIDTVHFKAPGCRSLPYYLNKLQNAAKILLVHNTFTDESDLKSSRESGGNLFYCLCPNANIFIENHLPDLELFQKYNVQIVLGTDSLASNRQLSIMEEMKTLKKKFPSILTSNLLLWATSNGAKALSFDKKLGNFSKGKRPGIVLIENTDAGEISSASTSVRML
jgi:cytosine/adenosine deaminase-related metal-dependent hydrolase